MNEHMRIIFYENPDIDELIRDFCRTDPEYQRIKREFYEAAHEIQRRVGFDLYQEFEQRFHSYISSYADLHYLFGLGLRQEVLRAFW